MAYGINGTILRFRDPREYNGGSLLATRQYTHRWSEIWSVNSPIVHSFIITGLDENEEPSPTNYDPGTQKGDVVNVVFDIYEIISPVDSPTFPTDYTLVASIRKSRDLRNISNKDKPLGGDGAQVETGHVFTVDISEVCKDLLSYSLLPHGKGTYTDWRYGGLNGGARPQDNLPINVMTDDFIVTKNGSFRKIQVAARTEIIDNNGVIHEATAGGSSKYSNGSYIIINNAPDYDTSQFVSVNMSTANLVQRGYGSGASTPRICQSFCPNYDFNSGTATPESTIDHGKKKAKDVRMDENSEVLYSILGDGNNLSIYGSASNPEGLKWDSLNTSDLIDDYFMEINAFDSTGAWVRSARLYDWNQCMRPRTDYPGGNSPNPAGATNVWLRQQRQPFTQNISPVFINANCIHNSSTVKDIWENGGETYTRYRIDTDGVISSPELSLFLNDEITYYSIGGTSITTTQGNGQGVTKRNMFEHRWYKIDRDRERASPDYSVAGGTYAGVYYTELRTDYATNLKKIRCKGLFWNQPTRPFVRMYWLNKAGGIDAYTFKGDAKISYNSNKDIILRAEGDRHDIGVGVTPGTYPAPYPYNNAPTKGYYQSDTLRGSNVYNGGLEVLNVDSTKSGSVFSLPLNQVKAEWLREIISSPNVWTEYSAQQTGIDNPTFFKTYYRSFSNIENGQGILTDGRHPSNMDYTPIIITNSSFDVYDDSQGLVTVEIEYTHAHAVVTQRN